MINKIVGFAFLTMLNTINAYTTNSPYVDTTTNVLTTSLHDHIYESDANILIPTLSYAFLASVFLIERVIEN